MVYESNPQLKLAFDFIQYTHQNVFLTGKAGTGKTTFLKQLKEISPKRMVVVAPTGVAAINAGGVTIHSFFQLPFGPQIPQDPFHPPVFSNHAEVQNSRPINRFSKNKIKLIRSLDLLIIDEISMVRADMLDAIDATLRRFKNRNLPFGGLQVLMIGDLQQLAPVVKDEDRKILEKYYDTFFFFSSHALKKSNFIGIELKKIFRQSEQKFIGLLNKVRDNRLDSADIEMLNNRYQPGFSPSDDEGYITLTTHNYQAKRINDAHLEKLSTKSHRFSCTVEGDFPEFAYPADEVLQLKTSAQVMFLKNDPSTEKRFYNGRIGRVTKIIDKEIEVLCPGDSEPIKVEPATWENSRYRLNESNAEVEEEVVGRFTQYPLKPAWAITIHKSQGLTFEKAIIDARQSFAHGQVYVALSRCKSLEGMVLSTPLTTQSVINDGTVSGFISHVEKNQPGDPELEKCRKEYELHLLNELFDFKPVASSLAWLIKLCVENGNSLTGNITTECRTTLASINKELVDVAKKFRSQIKKLVDQCEHAEDNPALQKRLKEASAYFHSVIVNRLVSFLQNITYETDNQTIQKRISDQLNRLETEIEMKQSGLKALADGFSIKNYLDARAIASVEKTAEKTGHRKAELKVVNPEFYRTLVKWRENKSRETGLDESKILRYKVMIDIAATLPSKALELKSVKGMGGKKMEQFGKDILALSLEFRKQKGMDIPLNAREEVELAGLDTREVSLLMFKQGQKPNEIATRRNLAISTIEKHLTYFVSRGQLDIFQLIDRKKYDQIAKYLYEKKDNESVTDIKNKLGESFSYSEIRMVIADFIKK